MTPTTYGRDFAYCLKSHGGVRGFNASLWRFLLRCTLFCHSVATFLTSVSSYEGGCGFEEYQIVTDADHVYVEKGNSQGKINKSDLISKLLAASELDKIKIISKSVVINQKLSLGLKNGLYFLIGYGNFGFCDLVSVYKKEITVIANEGYGTLIIGTDNIIAGQHCIYINETDNKIEFKQYSDVMNVTFGGIIA